ncbi:hypothetical protein [Flavisericum labens]|uniref:hypothetical protein n=1 Tax=Flavisericum labens TaxID=3377112 RepID=UPI00387B6751
MACTAAQKSPVETAQIVIESFYLKDLSALKQNTTPESYEAFTAVHDILVPSKMEGASNFKVLDEAVNGDTAWVRFSTSYSDEPETLKLVKVDGHWKVTEKGLREKSPF